MGESIKRGKCLVISGVNFFEGGPLTLMKDCIEYLDKSDIAENYNMLALVSSKLAYKDLDLKRVKLIEFPLARKSYLFRLFYEYHYFKKLSAKYRVDFWLSLHDITPRLSKETIQAVYCHNPAPFYKVTLREFFMEPTFGFFSYFYKYLYRINIKRNNFVIVQQQWIREQFASSFDLENAKIIVAHPGEGRKINHPNRPTCQVKKFFYPTLSRVFKNIELIGEAIEILNKRGIESYEVIVTVNGSENRYSKWIKERYGNNSNLKLIGKQPLNEVFRLYSDVDYLLFPSKLETWGLPITEFKQTKKPMLLADLPYAHETLGDYCAASFFSSCSSEDLANHMEKAIKGVEQLFSPHSFQDRLDKPTTNNWRELFKFLLAN